ncbi:DNA polymerase III subunit alpha [Candidatus Zixiibacteriota bacterium]
MSTPPFVHLHVHSQYSLLDGACRTEDMIAEADRLNMEALALTDHGVLFGAIEFYKNAMNSDVKPIIGCEVYVAPGDRRDKRPQQGGKASHLILLARNQTGYQNLMYLSSMGFLEGFYYRPRVDKALLRERSEGLIACSSCLQGEVSVLNVQGKAKEAKRAALEYQEIFGEGNFYLEIQNHDIEDEKRNIDAMISLSRELDIPLVATNDVHFMKPEHAESHEVLLCVQTGKTLLDPDRMHSNPQLFFRTQEEMANLFAGLPEALENTSAIAKRCNLLLEFGEMHLPRYPLPQGFKTLPEFLRHATYEGARKRFGGIDNTVEERLEFELKTIEQMGFPGYFLVVADFTRQARNMGVPVGPGRGSAAGSLVSYCLGITDIDPLAYDLLFERFLNPERVSMPDIDIDFCYERRSEIIRYVVEKYGEESVAQIITFGTMAARAAVRDVGRVMGLPYSDVDRLAKMVPEEIGIKLQDAISRESALQDAIASDDQYKRLFDHARVLEGLARHASTHAAGVVIAPGALTDYVPLYKGSKGETTTQYNMNRVEDVGLLKVDFLGLRTLTVLHDASELIKQHLDVTIVLNEIDLEDSQTFDLFSRGETIGIFQFESSGMRDYLRKLRPGCLEDLIAMNALYRPGPLGANMVDDFIDRKNGKKNIQYDHPLLEPILKSTYGIIVYQEQVMRIASELAGFSLGEADLLRRAMGKKKAEVMEEQRELFLDGAQKRGVERKIAENVFEQIAYFAGYGFNRSHSAGYAIIAWQTGYLKAHYPAHFMAASLSSEMSNSDRIVILIEECRRLGITVAPPNLNESNEKFTVTGDKTIRFGLGAVKNVGHSAIEAILQARSEHGVFKTFRDFLEHTDLKSVNRRVVESLISAGACDGLGGHRAQLTVAAGRELEGAQKRQADRDRGQVSLFDQRPDEQDFSAMNAVLPDVTEWPVHEQLSREKEALGFYVSGHPMERYRDEVNSFTSGGLGELAERVDGNPVIVAGVITTISRKTDRKGKSMAFVGIEDFTGSGEAIIFSDPYEKFAELIREENMILIKGKLSIREGEAPKVLADEIIPLEDARNRLTERLHLLIVTDEGTDMADRAMEVLKKYPGSVPVYLHIEHGEEGPLLQMKAHEIGVSPVLEVLEQLKSILGDENVWVST